MAYCMYLRKSRADQEAEARGEGETLTRHEGILFDLAAKLNISITKVYKEIVSGESIASRPVMTHVLNEVRSNIWEGVLVVEVERLARGDTKDQGVISEAFRISNTQIITPIKTFNPADEYDEEYLEFNLFMSRREYTTINRRIQRGRVRSIREGKWISPEPPYGYRRVKIKSDSGYTLEAEEGEGEAVALLFQWRVDEHIGATNAARRLDDLGFKPRKTKKWTPHSIRNMWANPVYAGFVKWGERAEVKAIDENGNISKTRPYNSNLILCEGLHAGLVDLSTFNKAQEIRKMRATPPTSAGKITKSPLAGIVECGYCGRKMTRREEKRKNRVWLLCANSTCNNSSSSLEYVEESLLAGLRDWLEKYELDVVENNNASSKASELRDALARYDEEISKVNVQASKLYELLEQGIYTTEVFLERQQVVENKKTAINDARKEIEKQIKEESAVVDASDFIPQLKHVLEIYQETESPADRNALLKSVVKKCIYKKPVSGPNHQKAFQLEILPLLEG